MPIRNSIATTTVGSLCNEKVQSENDEDLQLPYTDCIPESQYCVEDDTTFVVTNTGVVLNKISKYSVFISDDPPIEDAVGTDGCVADMVIHQGDNVSSCVSRIFDSCDRPIFDRSNPSLYVYTSQTFKSKATIKLPEEIQLKSGKFYYFQLSKINYKQYYGADIRHMFFLPDILKDEEYCLDCLDEVEPAYSQSSLAMYHRIPAEVSINLWDKPTSRIPSSLSGSSLTKVKRRQEFLVYLLMVVDGKFVKLHALKWLVELKWSKDSPDTPIHVFRIEPNEREIPWAALSNGKCNDNQIWYLKAGNNSKLKSGFWWKHPKLTEELKRILEPKILHKIQKR